MTTINNDDFKIKAVAKKAPAMKTPRVEESVKTTQLNQRLDSEILAVSEDVIKNNKSVKEMEEAITTLQRNADAQKQLISAVNDKNDTLQDKLTFVNDNNIKIVIPNATLKNAINEAIMKVNTQLADSVNEVNEVIEKLYQDDIQEALKQVSRTNDLKKTVERLDDNMYRLDDLDYDIENAVRSELDYCDYIKEDDVNDMVEDAINNGDYITREDIDHDLKIYGREINELRERLNNTLYNKVCRLVKIVFGYNLTNKVRSLFRRNKRKKIDINEIDVNKGMDLNEIANRIKASKK